MEIGKSFGEGVFWFCDGKAQFYRAKTTHRVLNELALIESYLISPIYNALPFPTQVLAFLDILPYHILI